MSLVINSNNAGGGGYAISNKDILTAYPDFENNILLTIDGIYDIGTSTTFPTAFTVNGTIVNFLSGSLCMPNDFLIKGNQDYRPPQNELIYRIGGNAGVSYMCRISTPQPIQSGLLIGKTLVVPELLITNLTANSYADSYIHINSVDVNFGLLHSDGTISYISQENFSVYGQTIINTSYVLSLSQSWSNSGRRQLRQICPQHVVSTNGITTQEGDYVIVEVVVNRRMTNNTSYPNVQIPFGSKASSTGSFECPRPFQISID